MKQLYKKGIGLSAYIEREDAIVQIAIFFFFSAIHPLLTYSMSLYILKWHVVPSKACTLSTRRMNMEGKCSEC